MGNKEICSWLRLWLLVSVGVNMWLVNKTFLGGWEWRKQKVAWSEGAATEAEGVASIFCSGHGRAYLDGVKVEGKPVCECNSCYSGPDCSLFSADCVADADSGDPLFLEPYWMQHASKSAVVISGWHRMSYNFPDSFDHISPQLIDHILRVHEVARNAITQGKHILFGAGSTQLLNAALFALSVDLSSPASVVSEAPFYSGYKSQTDFFKDYNYKFQGDASLVLNNSSYDGTNTIEFVTSPNNPDGNLRQALIAKGPSIYDHAYYWPHFTAIPAPADEDIMIFTISKLTGHAGSRFGWALVKDAEVHEKMNGYISNSEIGISRETQLRALTLMRAIVEREDDERELFDYAYHKMSDRWQKLTTIISLSKRFSFQQIPPLFCTFFGKVRGPSPGYAWIKCEREEDTNCYKVLLAAKIIGRTGNVFGVDDRYVRLSLLKGDDDFNILLYRLEKLVSQEYEAKIL